jgi:parallel beta-helix repeat protein
MVLQGVVPSTPAGCVDGRGPEQHELKSTIRDGCDSSDPTDCETVKIEHSDNIEVRFLNIIDGVETGVECRESTRARAYCNCIARHQERGIEFDMGGQNVALQNLVKDNGATGASGVEIDRSTGNTVQKNTVVGNKLDGITVNFSADNNRILDNLVTMNMGDGIRLLDGDLNQVLTNIVQSNGGRGVSLEESDANTADQNAIGGNGDGLINRVFCGPGSDNNLGSNVPPGSPCGVPATASVERRVAGSSDDAEQKGSVVSLTSSDLELVDDAGLQTVGIRFRNVTVPPGAMIVNAYVQFQVDEATTVATSLRVEGQNADNPGAFTTASNNVSVSCADIGVRQLDTRRVADGRRGRTGSASPNIKTVVQEIVNRPLWVSGNALVVIITGTTGKRVASPTTGRRAAPRYCTSSTRPGGGTTTTTVPTTTSTTTSITTSTVAGPTTSTTSSTSSTVVTTSTTTTTTVRGPHRRPTRVRQARTTRSRRGRA